MKAKVEYVFTASDLVFLLRGYLKDVEELNVPKAPSMLSVSVLDETGKELTFSGDNTDVHCLKIAWERQEDLG